MSKQKKLTIVVIVIILVATVFLLLMKIKKDKTTGVNQPTPVNMFGQKSDNAKTTEVTGNVQSIAEKTMTIKTDKGEVVVNINGATPVMRTVSGGQVTLSQIADVKLQDLVKVQYDNVTKNANLITIGLK